MEKKKEMETAATKDNGSPQDQNTHELVCKAFANDLSKYCSIIVAIHSILTMEVTRRAFMSLPYPDSPDYVIPDNSMTAMIHSFFLRRHRPKITGDNVPNDADQCNDKLRRIAKWLQWKCPDLFYFAEEGEDDDELEDDEEDDQENEEEEDDEDGSEQEDTEDDDEDGAEQEDAEDDAEDGSEEEQLGGEPVVALRDIRERLVKEVYVKGLKEEFLHNSNNL